MDDAGIIVALIGVVVTLIKMVDKVFDFVAKKFKKDEDKKVIVHLDPQASLVLAEILRKVNGIEETLAVKDHDGIPLAYFPRSVEERLQHAIDTVHDEVRRFSSSAKRG